MIANSSVTQSDKKFTITTSSSISKDVFNVN